MSTQQQSSTQHEHVEPGHGHSVAAWTGVAIILVGSLLSSVAMVLPTISWTLFVVGIVIIVLGAIAWKVMGNMGYGEKPHGH